MAVHCPECGFVNDEGANYCQKCGAYLGTPEPPQEETTATYKVDDETGEIQPVQIEDVVADTGAALVIRSGGGRTGENGMHGDAVRAAPFPEVAAVAEQVRILGGAE